MEQAVYWIWLQNALGVGNRKVKELISLYPSARDFYQGGEKEWRLCGCLTARELDKLEASSLEEAQKTLDRAIQLGQWTITPEEGDYPLCLKNICNPPCILYGKGQLPDLEQRLSVAVVGTRSVTPYGRSASFDIGFGLAQVGAVVVSGGALGVDEEAHKGALQAGGQTIAVLGCGINTDYLKENASLRYTISQSGALLSEFPPDLLPSRWTFPMRNRLISGLAQGTVVVEAGKRSGSLITANLALEQGRDVFAVPGNVNSSVSSGTNDLIKAGAKPVTCLQDILEEYENKYHWETSPASTRIGGDFSPESPPCKPERTEKMPEELPASPTAKQLYDHLKDQSVHVDALARETGLSIRATLQGLTELELAGVVQAMPGRRYRRQP